ncbi:caspase recruitment domain-containing protein 19 isoform X2 [Ciconia boyciana]|uniref:caspase recruitment domain-containing protein 19 isoform X2 n=1 Tax=Ciconia boyciana TaxID=52775 RepID=UPI003BA3A286
MGASPCHNKAARDAVASWACEHPVAASNAHVCFPDTPIAPKQGATFQPLGLVGLFLYVFFKLSSWSTILYWWAVSVGTFTSLVYQKPEGSSLCGLGRDFSESEERRKISEERDQSYCHRLQHDMYFLTSNSRLNEQVVDKIILQLNRVYPQILTNAEAEKFRNPKASLHTRLSDLIKHLQKKGDRHCQEFYRALQINAEQLYNDLPSKKILKTTDSTEVDTDKEKYMLNDRGPVFFLACFSVAAGFALFWYCCNSDGRCSNSKLAVRNDIFSG